ncbi:MAG: amidohydrolase [Candidatus Heimdallarchaeaceae archaeon]
MQKLYADLVIKNANIWTMNENREKARNLAVFQDIIVKVSDEKLDYLIGPKTILIDAENRTVLPGFIDSHTHIAWSGLNLISLNLEEASSIKHVLDLIKEEISRIKPGQWVIGRAWDQSHWPEQRYITAKDLDPISPENPVFLRHVSGHLVTVNTLAFEKLGLNKDLKGVDVDENDEIIGTLRDIELDDFEEIRPKFEDFVQGLKLGIQEALKLGITSIHDNITFETLFPYLSLVKKKELQIRVYGIIYENMIDEVAKLGINRNYKDKWFRIGACKLMTDGALSSRSAYLFEEYTDKKGEYGFPLYDESKLDEMITKVHHSELQIAAHAIGDRAVANLIDSIERNIDPSVCIKSNHRIEHAEILRESDVERAKKLGLVFSMQPNFVWRWGMIGINGMYEQRIGTERTMFNNPFGWILKNNLLLIFGSDGMPLGPLYGIKGALFHPNPELRLTLEQAIQCYTINPAKAVGEEDIKGSLEEGKLADIVLLSHNIEEIEIDEFHQVEVLCTIVGGEIKYKKENFLLS